MEKAEDKGKSKKIIGTIVGILAFGLSYVAVQQLFFKPVTFDKAMMEAASELNKTCPVMVDEETRLDNAMALPDNIFQYNYTLINLDKLRWSNLAGQLFCQIFQTDIIQNGGWSIHPLVVNQSVIGGDRKVI